MKILALITARGGSKRLPGKNIRILGGKPLIVWSIDVAKDISEICDILVSTDDSCIAKVSQESGAFVPWLRPCELASDHTSSVDVALHALDWYESAIGYVDALLLLQPTSPFRTKKILLKGIELFKKNTKYPVVGVSPTHSHPMWTFKTDGQFLVPFILPSSLDIRSQDLPPAYVVNGCFYMISPRELRKKRGFIGDKTIPLFVESFHEALDIDTEWDWFLAETFLEKANIFTL